jgi:hypothetical protein
MQMGNPPQYRKDLLIDLAYRRAKSNGGPLPKANEPRDHQRQ